MVEIHSKRVQFWQAIFPLLLIGFSTSTYESSIPVYLCGLVAIVILQYTQDAEADKGVQYYLGLLVKYSAIVPIAVGGKYGLAIILRYVMRPTIESMAWTHLSWGKLPILRNIWLIAESPLTGLPIRNAFSIGTSSLSLLIALVLCGILTAWLLRKLKSFIPVFLFIALIASCFSLSLLLGYNAPPRMCQSYSLFVGFTFMLTCMMIQGERLFNWVGTGALLIVTAQTHELSGWFANNYYRYQEDRNIIVEVGDYLLQHCNTTKPVVFTGSIQLSSHVRKWGSNGYSVINWSINAFGSLTSHQMFELMRMHGYDLIEPTSETASRATKNAADPVNPSGCISIEEKEDYILVQFKGGRTQGKKLNSAR
jgi:hypothetical protein